MPQIRQPLFWDDDDNNADHIWDRHKVSVDEVEEVIFEDAGEPTYVAFWKGAYYVVLGATAGGRLLKIAGEFVTSDDFEGSLYRPVHAMDMSSADKRRFRERLK